MRIAIFSDIHANLHALDATLTDMEGQAPDRTFCLGDLVGYGAFPNQVTARIRQLGYATVMGNYDDGVGFDRDDCGCAYKEETDRAFGQRSLEWTRTETTPENKAFLQTLVPEIRFEAEGKRILLVHGSPRKMNEYLFEDRALSSFQRLAETSNADIILFGHTHVPYTKDVNGVLFVNVGSVGKPKDGDPRSCYAMVHLGPEIRVMFRRTAYDVAAAADAIRQSDLPDKFAADLEHGGVHTFKS